MKLVGWGIQLVVTATVTLGLMWGCGFANSPHKDQARVPVQVDDDYLESMQRAMRQ